MASSGPVPEVAEHLTFRLLQWTAIPMWAVEVKCRNQMQISQYPNIGPSYPRKQDAILLWNESKER